MLAEGPTAFGEYLLLKKVAAGGMAEIHRAQLRGVGGFRREVAIKRIHQQHCDDESFIRMLLDEARIAAQLVHPNIAQVLNCGCIDRVYYIAMEFVDGQSLSQVLKRLATNNDKLAPLDAIHIGIMLSRALGYAHALHDDQGKPMGIVHRDVSPQNVIISYRGEAKLVDFGIARAADRLQKTETGIVKGKIAYMAPEQLTGTGIDHRADLYAAAIVTLESITGERAYGSGSQSDLLRAMLQGTSVDVATQLAGTDLPASLTEVLRKGLAKEPDDRYEDCNEFATALTEVTKEMPGSFAPLELGQSIRGLFAQELEQAEAEFSLIREQIARAPEEGSWEPATDQTVTAFTPTPVGRRAVSRDGAAAQPKKSRLGLVLGGLLLLAAATAAGFFLLAGPGMGRLKIVTEPAGANIEVDGKVLANLSPASTDELEAGSDLVVKATLPGFKPAQRQYRLAKGAQQLSLILEPEDAILEVVAAKPGAEVLVGGEPLGKADDKGRFEAKVAPGADISIRVEAPGGAPFEKTVTLRPGKPFRLQVPKPAAPSRGSGSRGKTVSASGNSAPAVSATGTVDIACLPWCQISVDGKPLGKRSPLRGHALPVGKHTVEVINPPSGKKDKKKVVVEAGKSKRLLFRLN